MTLKEKRAIDQKNINELAKQYYEMKKAGNSGQAAAVKWKLCEKIVFHRKGNELYKVENAVCSSLHSKCMNGFNFSEDEASMIIEDVFLKSIDKYEFDKNNNFTAYIEQQVFFECSHRTGKEYITQKNSSKDEKLKISRRANLERYDEDSELYNDGMEYIPDSKALYDYDKIEENNSREMRIALVSCITKFKTHLSGKSANDTKLSYFKIFVTEAVTKDINESRNYNDYNTGELPDVIDGNYVRFFAFTDFISADDLIDIKMKKYSDIIENGEEKEIKLNMEPRVIIPYRVKAGLDKKAVNPANVSQQKEQYKELMRKLLSEI